jgi:uncharacterized RDD family membrane protein YckC
MTSTPPSLPPPITEIGLRPAGFWIRLLASIIDTVVLTIILAPIVYTIYGRQYLTSTELVKGPADFLISYVLPALLVILLWITVRGTPGKLICGLRVVDARTGGKLDLLQATVRYLGYFVSMLALFLGFIWVAIDKRKQGFHDKMAGTLVIWNKSP